MKVAIMQPYFMPYIGYFQLLHAVDTFVLYDDVNYITRGYINRNNILLNGQAHRFTLPVQGASQNALIKDIPLANDQRRFLQTLAHAYGKTPGFRIVNALLQQALTTPRSITDACHEAMALTLAHLGLERTLVRSSTLDYDRQADAAGKLVSLCQGLGADTYINSPGGRTLYQQSQFASHGVSLWFIDPAQSPYPQGLDTFVPNLSMIDLLMRLPADQIRERLGHYQLTRSP